MRYKYHYLGTKSVFLMKVATQELAVFSSGDNTFSLNANAARPTLNLTGHVIISRAALGQLHWILTNLSCQAQQQQADDENNKLRYKNYYLCV